MPGNRAYRYSFSHAPEDELDEVPMTYAGWQAEARRVLQLPPNKSTAAELRRIIRAAGFGSGQGAAPFGAKSGVLIPQLLEHYENARQAAIDDLRRAAQQHLQNQLQAEQAQIAQNVATWDTSYRRAVRSNDITLMRSVWRDSEPFKFAVADKRDKLRKAALDLGCRIDPKLFGASAMSIATREIQEARENPEMIPSTVPRFMETVLARMVELRAYKAEGLFRVPGDAGRLTEVSEKFECSELVDASDPRCAHLSVYDWANLLTRWMRQLAEPLVPNDHRYHAAVELGRDQEQQGWGATVDAHAQRAQELLESLPVANKAIVKRLVRFLRHLDPARTGMSTAALSVVFAPSLMRHPVLTTAASNARAEAAFLQLLLNTLPEMRSEHASYSDEEPEQDEDEEEVMMVDVDVLGDAADLTMFAKAPSSQAFPEITALESPKGSDSWYRSQQAQASFDIDPDAVNWPDPPMPSTSVPSPGSRKDRARTTTTSSVSQYGLDDLYDESVDRSSTYSDGAPEIALDDRTGSAAASDDMSSVRDTEAAQRARLATAELNALREEEANLLEELAKLGANDTGKVDYGAEIALADEKSAYRYSSDSDRPEVVLSNDIDSAAVSDKIGAATEKEEAQMEGKASAPVFSRMDNLIMQLAMQQNQQKSTGLDQSAAETDLGHTASQKASSKLGSIRDADQPPRTLLERDRTTTIGSVSQYGLGDLYEESADGSFTCSDREPGFALADEEYVDESSPFSDGAPEIALNDRTGSAAASGNMVGITETAQRARLATAELIVLREEEAYLLEELAKLEAKDTGKMDSVREAEDGQRARLATAKLNALRDEEAYLLEELASLAEQMPTNETVTEKMDSVRDAVTAQRARLATAELKALREEEACLLEELAKLEAKDTGKMDSVREAEDGQRARLATAKLNALRDEEAYLLEELAKLDAEHAGKIGSREAEDARRARLATAAPNALLQDDRQRLTTHDLDAAALRAEEQWLVAELARLNHSSLRTARVPTNDGQVDKVPKSLPNAMVPTQPSAQGSLASLPPVAAAHNGGLQKTAPKTASASHMATIMSELAVQQDRRKSAELDQTTAEAELRYTTARVDAELLKTQAEIARLGVKAPESVTAGLSVATVRASAPPTRPKRMARIPGGGAKAPTTAVSAGDAKAPTTASQVSYLQPSPKDANDSAPAVAARRESRLRATTFEFVRAMESQKVEDPDRGEQALASRKGLRRGKKAVAPPTRRRTRRP